MRVFVTLLEVSTGRTKHREINPLAEEFRRNPTATIQEWMTEHGEEQHKSKLELLSYRTE